MKRTIRTTALSALLLLALLLNFSACSEIHATDLMEGITANEVSVSAANDDGTFRTDFAVRLLQASYAENGEGENILLSPFSLQLTLAMLANGADGQSLKELETVVGGGMTAQELNEALFAYRTGLPSGDKCKLAIANSIWFRDEANRFLPTKEFLQLNADYYGAQAYKCDFNDKRTLKEINQWVSDQTNGKIEEILDEISEDAVMFLLNALSFDAEWSTPYEKCDVSQETFTAANGEKQTAEMMHSTESRYIQNERATGFFKSYSGNQYSFVALLPNEDISLDEYIRTLTAAELSSALSGSEQNTLVSVRMPKFKNRYKFRANSALASMGLHGIWRSGDFSKLCEIEEVNVSEIVQKTYICVDEKGTRAGAASKVELAGGGFAAIVNHSVRLDRPFLYMIVDNASLTPIFIGTVTTLR